MYSGNSGLNSHDGQHRKKRTVVTFPKLRRDYAGRKIVEKPECRYWNGVQVNLTIAVQTPMRYVELGQKKRPKFSCIAPMTNLASKNHTPDDYTVGRCTDTSRARVMSTGKP